MPDKSSPFDNPADAFAQMLKGPQQLFAQLMPGAAAAGEDEAVGDVAEWTGNAQRLQALWLDFQAEQATRLADQLPGLVTEPVNWLTMMQGWMRALPLADPAAQKRMWEDSLKLWEGVLGQYGIGPKAADKAEGAPELPRKDRRSSAHYCQ